MWLARLFGGRTVKQAERPVRIAPRISAGTSAPAQRSPSVGVAKRGIHAGKVADQLANKAKSGFDPYNSGTFERGNAWERVIRR